METLINIKENNGQIAVSARELYECLGYDKSQFSRWAKKNIIENPYAIENEDWTGFDINVEGNTVKDYVLSIDFSKKCCMLSKTSVGEKVRNYFIEVEKQSQGKYSIPQSFSEALMLAANQAEMIEKQQIALSKASKEIQTLQPKADLMDKVLDCGEKIDVGQAAKILKLPYGRNKLFAKLREEGIFFKNRNEPKQQYIDLKYFDVFEQYIDRDSHNGFTVIKVLVTQKGLAFLNRTFNGNPSDKNIAKIK